MKVRLFLLILIIAAITACNKSPQGQIDDVVNDELFSDSSFTSMSIQISSWEINLDSIETVFSNLDTLSLSEEEKFRKAYLYALSLITRREFARGEDVVEGLIRRYTDKEHQPLLDELLAKSYFFSKNFERALFFFEKAVEADSINGDIERFLKNKYNVGACLTGLGRISETIALSERMQAYCKEIGNDFWYYDFRFANADDYTYLGQESQGLVIAREKIEYEKANGGMTTFSLVSLSFNLDANQLYDNAMDTLRVLKELCLRLNDSSQLAMYYSNMGSMYLQKGDNLRAWTHKDTANRIKERLEMRARNAQYHEIEMINLDLNKELELSELRHKTEADRVFKIWLSLFIALLIVVAVMVTAFFRNRLLNQRKLQAEQTERFNAERQLIGVNASLETLEAERKRVAMDLHDGIGVLASTAKLRVSQVVKRIDAPELKEILSETNEVLTEISNDVKRIAHNIMPSSLSKLGLKYAIEELIEKAEKVTDIKFEYELDEVEFDGEDTREIMLYRICQELLNNGLKYSKASVISFKLKTNNGQLILNYDDNGVGIEDNKAYTAGNGFNTMKSRIEYLKGKVDFRSAKDQGTHFEFTLPHEA